MSRDLWVATLLSSASAPRTCCSTQRNDDWGVDRPPEFVPRVGLEKIAASLDTNSLPRRCPFSISFTYLTYISSEPHHICITSPSPLMLFVCIGQVECVVTSTVAVGRTSQVESIHVFTNMTVSSRCVKCAHGNTWFSKKAVFTHELGVVAGFQILRTSLLPCTLRNRKKQYYTYINPCRVV